MTSRLKSIPKAVARYLGDAAHRRFIALIIALTATHILGKATDTDSVANILEIVIGGLGAAWTSSAGKPE